MAKDAETVLIEDAQALRFLHEVLHGPAGLAPDRRLPTLRERFGVAMSGHDAKALGRTAKPKLGQEC